MPAPYGDGSYATEPPAGHGLNIRDVFHLVKPKPDDPSNNSKVDSQYPHVAIITPDTLSNRFGGMWAKEKLDLTLPFSTEMYLHLGHRYNVNGIVADGMTFTLQNDPDGIDAIGGAGEGLGVYRGRKSTTSGNVPHGTFLRNSLVIEFDTYRNMLEDGGYVSDPGSPGSAHCALIVPRDDTILANDHKNVNYFQVTQTWVKFEATWTPNNTGGGTLDYTFNNHAESYTVNNILTTFNDTKVYWGFTGSTGFFTSVQAAAITKLPEQSALAEKTVTDSTGRNVDQDYVYAGDTLNYKIRVTSRASRGAIGPIVITDEISEYTTYTPDLVHVTMSTGEEFDIMAQVSGKTMAVSIDRTLAAEEDWVEVTFPVTVNTDAAHNIVSNTGTAVVIGIADEAKTNTTAVTILETGDPEKKVADNSPAGQNGSPVNINDRIFYQIDYFNFATVASTVVITDQLSLGMDYIFASDGGVYTEANRIVSWTFPDVPAGEAGTVTLEILVNADAEVVLENSALITIDGSQTRNTNVTKNPVIPKDPEKKVSDISDSGKGGTPVKANDLITYDISYLNYDETSADILIEDRLPDGVDFVSASNGGSHDPATHLVTWNLANLPSGAKGTVSVVVRVTENAVIKIENSASVKVGENLPLTSNVANNPIASPAPVKKVSDNSDSGKDDAPVSSGDLITYEISYFNYKETPATITITDQLSNSLDFITASIGGIYDDSTHTVAWVLPNIASGESGTVSITAQINSRAVIIVTNGARIWVDDIGPAPTNIVVNPITPPAPIKKVSATSETGQNGSAVQKGDKITYTISYQNYTINTTDITITDHLPIGVDFISASDGGTYDAAAHAVRWKIQNILRGDTGNVSITIQVNEKAVGKIINYASVQVGTDIPRNTNGAGNPIKGASCARQLRSTKCRKTIRGKKIWNDNDNASNARPPSVEIVLLRDGVLYKSMSLASSDNASYVFSCLPVHKNVHQKYEYQVEEAFVPIAYTKTIEGNNITNRL